MQVLITFPAADLDAAHERYEQLSTAARDLGRAAGSTWDPDGAFSFRLPSREAAAELRARAVPLPDGWTIQVQD